LAFLTSAPVSAQLMAKGIIMSVGTEKWNEKIEIFIYLLWQNVQKCQRAEKSGMRKLKIMTSKRWQ